MWVDATLSAMTSFSASVAVGLLFRAARDKWPTKTEAKRRLEDPIRGRRGLLRVQRRFYCAPCWIEGSRFFAHETTPRNGYTFRDRSEYRKPWMHTLILVAEDYGIDARRFLPEKSRIAFGYSRGRMKRIVRYVDNIHDRYPPGKVNRVINDIIIGRRMHILK
jgi:hypothetical protein